MILHVDANSFFASVEQALHPELKGRPVVTGKERGIASAASYEAKRAGVTRGMPIGEVQRVCPAAVVLPSDYETYSLFSKRMFEVVRRYTSQVEEYSIDECFAELADGGGRSEEQTVGRIKEELERELNVTFSVGLAPTKVLAKVASNWIKPSGLTFISTDNARDYLAKLSPEEVWGIGPRIGERLRECGISSAAAFADRSRDWIDAEMNKPQREIWYELNGTPMYALATTARSEYCSVSKTKTFTPPTRDRRFLFSQLSANIENACIKLRRHGLVARQVTFFLKAQDFQKFGETCELMCHSSSPHVVVDALTDFFDEVYTPAREYRATGIILSDLRPAGEVQLDMFEAQQTEDAVAKVYKSVDTVNARYGKHTVFLGSSLPVRGAHAGAGMREYRQHSGARNAAARRQTVSLPGEFGRRRLGIPLLGDVKA